MTPIPNLTGVKRLRAEDPFACNFPDKTQKTGHITHIEEEIKGYLASGEHQKAQDLLTSSFSVYRGELLRYCLLGATINRFAGKIDAYINDLVRASFLCKTDPSLRLRIITDLSEAFFMNNNIPGCINQLRKATELNSQMQDPAAQAEFP